MHASVPWVTPVGLKAFQLGLSELCTSEWFTPHRVYSLKVFVGTAMLIHAFTPECCIGWILKHSTTAPLSCKTWKWIPFPKWINAKIPVLHSRVYREMEAFSDFNERVWRWSEAASFTTFKTASLKCCLWFLMPVQYLYQKLCHYKRLIMLQHWTMTYLVFLVR